MSVVPVSASASGRFGVTRVASGSEVLPAAAAERRAVLAHHHGIDHQRERKPAAARATARTISGEPSAPVLAACGGMSSSTAASCSSTSASGQHLDARDAQRVLDGEKRDDGLAVDAELVEGLEVGLDARAAAGVGSGDRQGRRAAWTHRSARRMRSAGWILRTARGSKIPGFHRKEYLESEIARVLVAVLILIAARARGGAIQDQPADRQFRWQRAYVVQFPARCRHVAARAAGWRAVGFDVIEHPDLRPDHLLAAGPRGAPAAARRSATRWRIFCRRRRTWWRANA